VLYSIHKCGQHWLTAYNTSENLGDLPQHCLEVSTELSYKQKNSPIYTAITVKHY